MTGATSTCSTLTLARLAETRSDAMNNCRPAFAGCLSDALDASPMTTHTIWNGDSWAAASGAVETSRAAKQAALQRLTLGPKMG